MAQDAKKGFLLYYDYRKHLALLNDEERGKLLMALLDYGEHGTQPEGKYDNDKLKGGQGHGDNSGHSGGQNGNAGKRDETPLSGFQMADS